MVVNIVAKESEMHEELFDWLREENLPEKEIPRNEKKWFREIAVGFNRLGMKRPDFYKGIDQKELSREYGFISSGLLQSIDYVCIIGKRAWVLEGKKDPNHAAIGQVLVYKDLFKMIIQCLKWLKQGLYVKSPIL